VEIMLALAVVAIGLVAIIGLIPQGIQASRDAADNTLAATIVHDTFAGLRAQVLEPTATWPPTLTADTYYDATGTSNYSTASPSTYYDVRLAAAQSTPNLITVSAMVMWPVKATGAKPLNTNTFVTTIANYQH
jgi:uncharacterized protein (TIGR02598 family)